VTVTGGPGKAASPEEVQKNEQFRNQARLGFRRSVAECKPAGTGGQIRPPRKIRDVRPRYPESARIAGIGGTAKLVAVIGTEGTVTQVQSVDQSVQPELVDAAIEAIKQWEFDGTLLNCTPIEVEMTVSVGFNPTDRP
jgi:TonB family protein